jgi:hypothetical protein
MTRHRRLKVSVATFRSDPLFPRIERAVVNPLKINKVVTPIDVFVGMHLLNPEHVLPFHLPPSDRHGCRSVPDHTRAGAS